MAVRQPERGFLAGRGFSGVTAWERATHGQAAEWPTRGVRKGLHH